MLKLIGIVCALLLLGIPQVIDYLQLAPNITGKKYIHYIFLAISFLVFLIALII